MNKYIQSYIDESVGIIQLNRPKVLNALNRKMVEEIVGQLEMFDRDPSVRVIVLRGSEQAFAAGADIDEMIEETPLTLELANPFAEWDKISLIKKPILAAVNGFALGGGFELALHCDLIIAADDARFGFPEVKLGVMPGAGGTQFLTKALGTKKALEWIWLGEQMSASVAFENGIINRIVARELVVEETMRLAHQLAKQPPISIRMIKEAVYTALDESLKEGKTLERKNFYLTFASEDQKEGMQAFSEKRPPSFKGV
ncbi:enoyl-CoA hydratase/isomerase family protein [Ornithinibacillus scapharcae]|uniref:enoyl-CoA hydratase/isomerase family protein n=1 Tax=Ornithinibacillus scapharcae TaxID=1147159 RepID=UPI000225B3CB|nr:enoyl-CoA hydratase-related protein [Ornithinibacillus scapharcae]